MRPGFGTVKEVSGDQSVVPLQTTSTPLSQCVGSPVQAPGGGLALAGTTLAGWKTNSSLKSPMNSQTKSSSRLQARTYDGLDHQMIVEEEEVDVGRFNNTIADLSRKYAAYFNVNPSKGDLDRFCSHFLDICPSELGADERLMAKVHEDMKWVYDRPHLHRSVRSINFVWHMAKMREKDEIYIRQISYFIESFIREGKSVEDALRSCAKAMNLDFARFEAWSNQHLSLQE